MRLSLLTEILTGPLVEFININRDRGIEIPEERTDKETVPSPKNANDALDRNPPTMSEVRDTPITNNHGGIKSSQYSVNRYYHLMKTYSTRSKRRDQYLCDNRKANDI